MSESDNQNSAATIRRPMMPLRAVAYGSIGILLILTASYEIYDWRRTTRWYADPDTAFPWLSVCFCFTCGFAFVLFALLHSLKTQIVVDHGELILRSGRTTIWAFPVENIAALEVRQPGKSVWSALSTWTHGVAIVLLKPEFRGPFRWRLRLLPRLAHRLSRCHFFIVLKNTSSPRDIARKIAAAILTETGREIPVTGSRGAALSDSTGQPAGYCPGCGYPIDPGRCPECGHETAEGDLVYLPRQPKRHRLIAHGALILSSMILGVLIAEGRYLARGLFAPYRSTATLIEQAKESEYQDESVEEVWLRFVDSKLTSAEADAMLASILEIREPIVRSPHPRGCDIQLKVDINSKLHGKQAWKIVTSDFIVTFDGKELEPPSQPFPNQYKWRVDDSCELAVPSPGVGPHEIVLLGTFSLVPAMAGTMRPSDAPTTTIDIRKTVIVEDKPLVDYVAPVWSEQAAEELKAKMKLAIECTPGINLYWIKVESFEVSVPVAGRIQVRYAPGEPFQSLPYAEIRPYGNGYVGGHGTFRRANGVTLTMIDVRLVGDQKFAFDEGLTGYFAGVIEWDGVPVTVKSGGAGAGGAVQYARPARVFPLK